jgi:MSHA biogenesis protein MshN
MKKILFSSLLLALLQPAMAAGIPASAPLVCTPATPVKKASKKLHRIKKPAARPGSTVTATASLYEQAINALKHGRVSEAQALLQQQLQQAPGHEAARKLQVTLYLDAGKTAEAAVLLREGQARNPASLDMAMTLARIEADRGLTDAAQATLKKSAPYAERNGSFLAFMAALEQKNGRHDEAEKLLTQALALQPATAGWLFARGVSRQVQGKDAQARSDFETALTSRQLDQSRNAEAQQRLRQLQK